MTDAALPVICIVGPTASGKTDAAQLVAAAIDGEVVSADSMQIYRGMDIGTGKLPAPERIVPHHGFDLVDPGEPYSAALFQSFARDAFAAIAERGKRAVLCGGTGLYVKAAIDAYEFPAGDQVGNPVRERWTAFAEREGAQALWDELNRLDPDSARELHPNNVRRVVRAFELLAEGRSYAEQKRNLASIEAAVPAVQFGLAVTPTVLNERIDARVDAMVEAGLVGEVRGLLNAGFREGVTAPQAIGYKEIVEALEGRCTLDEAIAAIKQATRRYGKRQRTWFRRDERIRWIDADAGNARAVADTILAQLETLT
ncbi:tRNA (adenosine(37)-N6)-dimethylallyltransferase MiaA [uncultured Adlercreutzia sp.]|uniref:tRNA (adenosine(37)-N6)-dimethylallyltransferase MiaA n=1 Tax=uncultured Adlercreutzia sp. TaxID=875803 RepID=UPI0025A561C3|nr:tRNA (adenosine(37)-N6)-dimethylallyltransferase MiaA [uncultured Adlercreutzia sp.]